MIALFKLLHRFLSPSVVKGIMDYVFDKNDADYRIQYIEKRIDKLERKTKQLKEKKK